MTDQQREVILGLDPAAQCGWAMSSGDHGVWQLTAKDDHMGRRLERLRRHIYALHQEHHLTVMATENASIGSNNVHTAGMHNELRGIIKLVAAELELPLVLVAPSTLKKWLTGHGGAKKEHMIDAIRIRFGIHVADHNIADAIAVMEYAKSVLTTSERMTQNDLFKKTKGNRKTKTNA